VESGGTLVAFADPAWGPGLPERFFELLGIAPGDPRAPLPPELAAGLGSAGGFYRELRPSGNAREAVPGLAFLSARGAGSVTALSFRPGGGSFPSKTEAPLLHQALGPALERASSFSGNAAGALQAMEKAAPQALATMAGLRAPARGTVLVALAVYLLGGFFVPAVLFRKLGRREWTFLVVALASLLATLAIYRYGLLSGLKASELEEITVLRLHAGSGAAEATSYLGFVSPGMQRLVLDGPPGAPQPLRGELEQQFSRNRPMAPLAPLTVRVSEAEGFLPLPLSLYPSTMLSLRYDYRLPAHSLVSLRREGGNAGGPGDLVLRNLGRKPMELFVKRGGREDTLGIVAPGEERALRRIGSVSSPAIQSAGIDPDRWPLIQHVLPKQAVKGLFLLALTEEPVFPAPRSIVNRKAKTLIILETPEPAH
jgi:hypothetical protein